MPKEELLEQLNKLKGIRDEIVERFGDTPKGRIHDPELSRLKIATDNISKIKFPILSPAEYIILTHTYHFIDATNAFLDEIFKAPINVNIIKNIISDALSQYQECFAIILEEVDKIHPEKPEKEEEELREKELKKNLIKIKTRIDTLVAAQQSAAAPTAAAKPLRDKTYEDIITIFEDAFPEKININDQKLTDNNIQEITTAIRTMQAEGIQEIATAIRTMRAEGIQETLNRLLPPQIDLDKAKKIKQAYYYSLVSDPRIRKIIKKAFVGHELHSKKIWWGSKIWERIKVIPAHWEHADGFRAKFLSLFIGLSTTESLIGQFNSACDRGDIKDAEKLLLLLGLPKEEIPKTSRKIITENLKTSRKIITENLITYNAESLIALFDDKNIGEILSTYHITFSCSDKFAKSVAKWIADVIKTKRPDVIQSELKHYGFSGAISNDAVSIKQRYYYSKVESEDIRNELLATPIEIHATSSNLLEKIEIFLRSGITSTTQYYVTRLDAAYKVRKQNKPVNAITVMECLTRLGFDPDRAIKFMHNTGVVLSHGHYSSINSAIRTVLEEHLSPSSIFALNPTQDLVKNLNAAYERKSSSELKEQLLTLGIEEQILPKVLREILGINSDIRNVLEKLLPIKYILKLLNLSENLVRSLNTAYENGKIKDFEKNLQELGQELGLNEAQISQVLQAVSKIHEVEINVATGEILPKMAGDKQIPIPHKEFLNSIGIRFLHFPKRFVTSILEDIASNIETGQKDNVIAVLKKYGLYIEGIHDEETIAEKLKAIKKPAPEVVVLPQEKQLEEIPKTTAAIAQAAVAPPKEEQLEKPLEKPNAAAEATVSAAEKPEVLSQPISIPEPTMTIEVRPKQSQQAVQDAGRQELPPAPIKTFIDIGPKHTQLRQAVHNAGPPATPKPEIVLKGPIKRLNAAYDKGNVKGMEESLSQLGFNEPQIIKILQGSIFTPGKTEYVVTVFEKNIASTTLASVLPEIGIGKTYCRKKFINNDGGVAEIIVDMLKEDNLTPKTIEEALKKYGFQNVDLQKVNNLLQKKPEIKRMLIEAGLYEHSLPGGVPPHAHKV